MGIHFSCPQCRQALTAPDRNAGVRWDCPGCGNPICVPQEPASWREAVAPDPAARPPARRSNGPDKNWFASNPVLVILLALGGGSALLFTCCGGFLFLAALQPTAQPEPFAGGSPVPNGPFVNPMPGGPQGGLGAGQPAGGGLVGTYRRRPDDAGTVLPQHHITFYPDGRFEEQGFLAAALGTSILPGGGTHNWDPNAGGQGTYRYTGTQLELTYTTQSYTPAKGRNTIPMSAEPFPGDASALLINIRRTFVRIR